MPSNPALTSPELAALNAANSDCPVYLSYTPDTIIATASVASSPSDPVSTISVSGTSANWLTARAGQMARFKDGSGNLVATRRVISTGGSTLKVDLSALADVGLIPLKSRSHAISSGDSVEIVERYDLWNRRPFASGGVIYQDGDIVYADQNLHPVDIWNCTINDQPGDFFCMVANGGTQAITAALTKTAWFMNAGFSYSYLWSYPASFTSVSGDTTATLTATAPVGAHWIYCRIIPSLGDTFYLTRFIRVHSPSDPPIYCNVTQDKRTRQSRSVTVRLVKERAADLPIKGYAAIWSDGTWGGSDVATATKKFCGYINSDSYRVVPGYHEATIQIQGVADILDTVTADAINFNYLIFDGWEALPGEGQNLNQIMHWVAYYRVMNLLQRFNWRGFTTDYHLATLNLITAPRSSVYAMLKRLATRYEANCGSRSDGELMSAIHPSMLADRSGVVTRGTLDATIYSNCTVTYRQEQQVGLLRYEGATSTTLVFDVALISQSPSESTPGQHPNSVTESEKVFENQANANQLSGDSDQMKNNPYPKIDVEIPGNWDVFEMPDMLRVVVNIASQYSPTGQAFSLTCIPVEMEKIWLPGRKARIKLTLEGETDGSDGVTVTIPMPIATTPTVPAMPTTGTVTVDCGTVTLGGDYVVAQDDLNLRLIANFVIGVLNSCALPTTNLIGSGHHILDFVVDPTATISSGVMPCYAANEVGFYHISNGLSSSATWTHQYTSDWCRPIIRPFHQYPGWVAVSNVGNNAGNCDNDSLTIYVFSNYGATLEYTVTIAGTTNAKVAAGIDVNQSNLSHKIIYTSTRVTATDQTNIYRIVDGTATSIGAVSSLVTNPDGHVVRTYGQFIQLPLLDFGGSANISLTNETLIWCTSAYDHEYALITSGGGSIVNKPTPTSQPMVASAYMSSSVAGDNSNTAIVATPGDAFSAPNTAGLWVTLDRAVTWTLTTNSNANNAGLTCGYYPLRINGQLKIYTGGYTKMGYISAIGSPLIEKTPDWTVSGGIRKVIPLSAS